MEKGKKSWSMLLWNFSFSLLLTCQNPQTSLNSEGFRLRFTRLRWALVHKHFLPITQTWTSRADFVHRLLVFFNFFFFFGGGLAIFVFRARWTFSLGPSVCSPLPSYCTLMLSLLYIFMFVFSLVLCHWSYRNVRALTYIYVCNTKQLNEDFLRSFLAVYKRHHIVDS